MFFNDGDDDDDVNEFPDIHTSICLSSILIFLDLAREELCTRYSLAAHKMIIYSSTVVSGVTSFSPATVRITGTALAQVPHCKHLKCSFF